MAGFRRRDGDSSPSAFRTFSARGSRAAAGNTALLDAGRHLHAVLLGPRPLVVDDPERAVGPRRSGRRNPRRAVSPAHLISPSSPLLEAGRTNPSRFARSHATAASRTRRCPPPPPRPAARVADRALRFESGEGRFQLAVEFRPGIRESRRQLSFQAAVELLQEPVEETALVHRAGLALVLGFVQRPEAEHALREELERAGRERLQRRGRACVPESAWRYFHRVPGGGIDFARNSRAADPPRPRTSAELTPRTASPDSASRIDASLRVRASGPPTRIAGGRARDAGPFLPRNVDRTCGRGRRSARKGQPLRADSFSSVKSRRSRRSPSTEGSRGPRRVAMRDRTASRTKGSSMMKRGKTRSFNPRTISRRNGMPRAAMASRT